MKIDNAVTRVRAFVDAQKKEDPIALLSNIYQSDNYLLKFAVDLNTLLYVCDPHSDNDSTLVQRLKRMRSEWETDGGENGPLTIDGRMIGELIFALTDPQPLKDAFHTGKSCIATEMAGPLLHAQKLAGALYTRLYGAGPSMWTVQTDLYGVIDQIDNMVADLVRPDGSTQPPLDTNLQGSIINDEKHHCDQRDRAEFCISNDSMDTTGSIKQIDREVIAHAIDHEAFHEGDVGGLRRNARTAALAAADRVMVVINDHIASGK